MKSNEADKPELLAELAWRIYPHTFAEHCRLACEGGAAFKSTGLARYLGALIADAVFAGGARLIVNVAPRQGKSEVCSFATPVWLLDNFPHKRVIAASHTAELAHNFGRRVRNAFDSSEFLSTKLREDSKAANRWNTDAGGGMLAMGVNGFVTGFGADLILVDDPHKGWAEAHSPLKRKRVYEWFDGTLMSRLEPGGSVIVIMQRWHNDDLTGQLVKAGREPWQVITLPALALVNDPMGRPPGSAICPERYDIAAMERIRQGRSKAVWDANYQQDPQASGDGRVYASFKRATHVRPIVTALRDDLPLQLAWDFNRNPGVHCILGQHDRRKDLFVARHEVFSERANTPQTMKHLKDLFTKIDAWPNGKFRWGVCEVYGDRSGKSENTTTADTDYEVIARELKAMNVPFRFRVPDANPPIKARVTAVNEAFCDSSGQPHYLIHPDCTRLIRDYEEVMEDEDGLIDKESDSDLSHPSDAEGYRIFAQRRPLQRKVTGGRVYTADQL